LARPLPQFSPWLGRGMISDKKIECIASWLREGHIKPFHLNRMGLPIEPQLEDNTEEIDNDVADFLE
jgi:hypothetical protein